ncbi:MAG: cell division protein ZapA [Bacteroidota bacterium]|nr:cell division protein ZapA [Bacteroidota bacterium]
MDELSIKVSIANRQYPLKIKREDEERVRKAAKMLNDRFKEYESNYSGSDKFDIIAMCAMQFASELVNTQEEVITVTSDHTSEIENIGNMITACLKENNVH